MTVTNVTIHKTIEKGKLKAIASVVINNCLRIDNIKVIQVNERLFVAMPSRKTADGGFIDVIHPISAEAKESIELPVLNEYDNCRFGKLWEECDEMSG
jgi:stage V sporulation protein G